MSDISQDAMGVVTSILLFLSEQEVLIYCYWWLAVKITRWHGSLNALSLRAPALTGGQ